MVYGYTSIFFHHVSKGEILVTICLPTLKMKSSQKWGQVLWEEFALVGANSCPYKMTPFYMGGNNDNDRVASPESVSIHLNESCCIFSTDLFIPLYILYTILLPCVIPLSIHDMAQQFFSDFSKSYVDKDIHKRVFKKPPY